MNAKATEVYDSFNPQLIDTWKRLQADSETVHDLGLTPEWCINWTETYRNAYRQLLIVHDKSSVYPFIIRRKVGLRVLNWIGQTGGMESDYCGGAGSYNTLLDSLIDRPGWDIADLQIPYWQSESAVLLKTLVRYEKYLWAVEVDDQSVVIDLPKTFEDWLATLAKTPRNHARRFVKNVDEGAARFEILTGADIPPALDDLIANNRRQWNVLSTDADVEFLKKTVQELEHNPNLFLARLADGDFVPACCLGYCSGQTVFIHTAGICREKFRDMDPGIALYALLLREMIRKEMRMFDFCPGLEEYKFRLGGRWAPNHRLIFARNRLAYCRYRAACSIAGFLFACRTLIARKLQ